MLLLIILLKIHLTLLNIGKIESIDYWQGNADLISAFFDNVDENLKYSVLTNVHNKVSEPILSPGDLPSYTTLKPPVNSLKNHAVIYNNQRLYMYVGINYSILILGVAYHYYMKDYFKIMHIEQSVAGGFLVGSLSSIFMPLLTDYMFIIVHFITTVFLTIVLYYISISIRILIYHLSVCILISGFLMSFIGSTVVLVGLTEDYSISYLSVPLYMALIKTAFVLVLSGIIYFLPSFIPSLRKEIQLAKERKIGEEIPRTKQSRMITGILHSYMITSAITYILSTALMKHFYFDFISLFGDSFHFHLGSIFLNLLIWIVLVFTYVYLFSFWDNHQASDIVQKLQTMENWRLKEEESYDVIKKLSVDSEYESL